MKFRFILRYVLQQIRANAKRTTLTLICFGFAVFFATVSWQYARSIMGLWQRGAVETGVGHVTFYRAGFSSKLEGLSEETLLHPQEILQQTLAGDSRIAAQGPRLRFEGLISKDDESFTCLGLGVDAEAEQKIAPRLFTEKDIGSFLTAGRDDEVLLGVEIAELLKIKLGDEVTIIAQTLDGSVNGVDATVVGIVDASIPSFSKRTVMLPLKKAQRLLRAPDAFSEWVVRLDSMTDAVLWLDQLWQHVPQTSYEARGWWQLQPVIVRLENIWHSVIAFVTGLLFVIAAFAVLNLMFLIVQERTTEIGVLVALGGKRPLILGLFSCESAMLGVMGAFLGVGCAFVVLTITERFGITFTNPFGGEELVIRPTFDLTVALISGALCFITALIASLPAAWRAAHISPSESLRGMA